MMRKVCKVAAQVCNGLAVALVALALLAGGSRAVATMPFEGVTICYCTADETGEQCAARCNLGGCAGQDFCKDHASQSLCEASPRDCDKETCQCTWTSSSSKCECKAK